MLQLAQGTNPHKHGRSFQNNAGGITAIPVQLKEGSISVLYNTCTWISIDTELAVHMRTFVYVTARLLTADPFVNRLTPLQAG